MENPNKEKIAALLDEGQRYDTLLDAMQYFMDNTKDEAAKDEVLKVANLLYQRYNDAFSAEKVTKLLHS